MFSLFKSKAQRHQDKLREIYFQKAKKSVQNISNKELVKQELMDFDKEFFNSDTYKEYQVLASKEGWSIYDLIRDEGFVLIAMFTQGLSQSAARNMVKQFNKLTGW